MPVHPLTSHDPRWPYDVACISFSVLAPLTARAGHYEGLLEEACAFCPALERHHQAVLEFLSRASIGRKVLCGPKQYRVINMAVRVCSKEPWDPEEAHALMESVANQIWDIPETVLGSPLLDNTGIVSWDMGVPIPDEACLRTVLRSLRISLNGRQGVPLYPMGKRVEVTPPADYNQSLKTVMTSLDLKRVLPAPIFHRFFDEKVPVWGYKVHKNEWQVVVPTEGPEGEGPKKPPSLQNFARLGVLEQCLKMKRAGTRYAPY